MSVSRDGGKPNVRETMNYSEPMGPKRGHAMSPGLGEDNYGCCGTQGGGGSSASTSGSPGLHGGAVRSNGGAQGKR